MKQVRKLYLVVNESFIPTIVVLQKTENKKEKLNFHTLQYWVDGLG